VDITAAIMAGGLLFAGSTVDAAPGGWLGVEGRLAWVSVGIEARGISITADPHDLSSSGTDLVRFSGLVVPCFRWKVLLLCGFVETGPLTFSMPRGFVEEPAGAPLSFGPRAGIDIPLLGGFAARGFADLTIHPAVAGFLGGGLAWSL
jgi:hypothetical protein